MNHQLLRAKIDAIARLRLTHLPTPLEHCPRLTEALQGPELYVKRDDLTGLAMGGNKLRQLEFLLADAASSGADVIVAGAYSQSNWCRQITAAATRLGVDVALVLLHGEKGPQRQGNLLLCDLMGADITVIDGDDMQQLPAHLHRRADSLRSEGRKPFVVDPFSLDVLARSAIGYVAAAVEIDQQLSEQDKTASFVYVSGANMTPAGLALGFKALGRNTRVVGVSPVRWQEPRDRDIARIASRTSELLGLDLRFDASDIETTEDYIGAKYGVVTEQGKEALRLAARTEGLILDPVYTSKAMAALIDHIRKGRFAAGDTVVFVHTGGIPALFSYADDVL